MSSADAVFETPRTEYGSFITPPTVTPRSRRSNGMRGKLPLAASHLLPFPCESAPPPPAGRGGGPPCRGRRAAAHRRGGGGGGGALHHALGGGRRDARPAGAGGGPGRRERAPGQSHPRRFLAQDRRGTD